MPAQAVHDRHRAQVAGLRHRAVRQEPPRRPEQVPADGARLRRVLRLPLPPRRDVGPVLVRLPAGLDRQDRPAQPGAFLGDRHGRPDRDAALGQGRQAEDRRRRPAGAVPEHGRTPELAGRPQGQIRHGDLRRGAGRAQQGLHGQGQEGRQAVLRLAQHHAHARLHLPLAEVPGDDELREQLRPGRSRHGADGRQHRRAAEAPARTSARPTTPSSSSPPTTAPRSSPGRTAA